MESSGPEGGKVRGPAPLIYERYLQLARDAASSGDRVLSENYLQHADHYFRLARLMQPATPPQQQHDRSNGESEYEGGEESAAEADSAEDAETSAESEQPDVEFPQGQTTQGDRGEGDARRRRGRRSRYRPEGDGAEAREGGDDQQARRQPRERSDSDDGRRARSEDSGPEGFSHGPKPAFLRNDS